MMPRYGAIVADPPWFYKNKKTGGNHTSGASQKYDDMRTADICRLPVREIAAKNSILFLWSTVPMLPDALQVLDAWGFTYKGSIVWVKTTAAGDLFNGLGYHFRGAAELLLFGIRGQVPALRCQMPNVVEAPIRRHSEKPPEVWRLIEEAIDGREDLAPRLEMFCRGRARDGWTGWGDQCIDGADLAPLQAGATA